MEWKNCLLYNMIKLLLMIYMMYRQRCPLSFLQNLFLPLIFIFAEFFFVTNCVMFALFGGLAKLYKIKTNQKSRSDNKRIRLVTNKLRYNLLTF